MEGPEIQFAEVEIDNGIYGKRHVRFETGRLAKQANGSVLVTIDDETTLLSATVVGKSPREGFDFFPLTVDVEERMYAAGKIPASYFRREGRPSTEAILAARLIDRPLRPERGLLAIRKDLNLFANLRPAVLYPELANASTLKPEIVAGLDILIVRELTGDIYFGEPRGIRVLENGEREGYNTMKYSESEIRRIAHVAFQSAQKRSKKVCSVGKANVLETTELWREIFEEIGKEYPDVELSHMYVDNAAMQLVRAPKQFDVIATGNIFGDILSDEASMLTGSIGMLPSASLDENGKGLYEPSHGSAPDIAGQNKANPLATILSLAMLLRYSLNDEARAQQIENAVQKVLQQGLRTGDIYEEGTKLVSCSEMGDAVLAAL